MAPAPPPPGNICWPSCSKLTTTTTSQRLEVDDDGALCTPSNFRDPKRTYANANTNFLMTPTAAAAAQVEELTLVSLTSAAAKTLILQHKTAYLTMRGLFLCTPQTEIHCSSTASGGIIYTFLHLSPPVPPGNTFPTPLFRGNIYLLDRVYVDRRGTSLKPSSYALPVVVILIQESLQAES